VTYRACVVAVLLCAGWGALLAVDGSVPDGAPPEFVEGKDVCFPHAMHADDFGIECVSCHHETNATTLNIPHEEYFEDLWIDCATCHKPGDAVAGSMACSSCHHNSTTDIADQTLSSKVVIHKSCWNCHEAGTGAQASGACKTCHNNEHLHPTPEQAGDGDTAEQPD